MLSIKGGRKVFSAEIQSVPRKKKIASNTSWLAGLHSRVSFCCNIISASLMSKMLLLHLVFLPPDLRPAVQPPHGWLPEKSFKTANQIYHSST